MEHYDPEDFDEKATANQQEQEEVYMMDEEDPAALLLSDQLMEEDDDESEIYEMAEDAFEEEDYEVVAGTPEAEDMDASFYIDDEEDDDDDAGFVQENPFEPVYPASAALLGSDENANLTSTEQNSPVTGKGIVLEAISLDNILPAGSRRRRN